MKVKSFKVLKFLFLLILIVVFSNAFSYDIIPEIQGIYNSFSLNLWNLALVVENNKYAAGLRIFDESMRSESYKLGFVTMKRQIDKSYFNLLTFVGQSYGVVLTIGYENYSIPTTGYERTYYISSTQSILAEYSKTWFSIPALPVGETTIGPFTLNYEGFSLSRLGISDPHISINMKRGFANIDPLQLSFVQIGNIYSLGFYVFSDKSLEQGTTVNLGWDFDERRIVGVLGGRIFIDLWDFRFFFSAYGTYIPSSENVKYGIWFRFLSPIQGDLIIQNNVGYLKIKMADIF
ncbi:MAG: hypothetical protein ACK4E1_04395 [Fervidobacterium nodosum]